MNWLEKYFLKRIVRKLVHKRERGIQEYYSYIVKSSKEQFSEDNDITIRNFLEEQHDVISNKEFIYAQKEISK